MELQHKWPLKNSFASDYILAIVAIFLQLRGKWCHYGKLKVNSPRLLIVGRTMIFVVSTCDIDRGIYKRMRGWMSGTFCETFAFWSWCLLKALCVVGKTYCLQKSDLLKLKSVFPPWRRRKKSVNGLRLYYGNVLQCWAVLGMLLLLSFALHLHVSFTRELCNIRLFLSCFKWIGAKKGKRK